MARLFRLRFGDYEGAIDEISTQFTYRFNKNVGIALGVDYFRTRIDTEDPDFHGSFNWEFVGPTLYLVLGF
ncbi:MAG: hypothetical protein JRF63_07940 [Deltaproteobacteria bacterium]|nr:hypothetical protein [Deltaproteobacteria bacterium]